MSRKIEEAFNDCFERLLCGESLESCVSRYPEFADELDSMLRTTFDIKRRAYPIQPRPEFKYWGRTRLQNIQESTSRQQAAHRSSSFNFRRNLAISMAALLVFLIASSGTAAASSDALPDQPLYGVKLAVEQVQLTLTPSDSAKAELYASLAEKRAQEIAVMANQGKTDKVISTTTKMYYQLDQAEQFIIKSETAAASSSTGWVVTPPTTTTAPSTTITAPAPTTTIPSPSISSPSQVAPTLTAPADQRKIVPQGENAAQSLASQRTVVEINKARTAINASAVKSLTILQNAMDKAPASVKPNLSQIIERTKLTNDRINARPFPDPNFKPVPPGSKLNDDADDNDDKEGTDRRSPLVLPNRKKVIPPPTNQPLDKRNQGSDSGQLDTSLDTTDDGQSGNTGTFIPKTSTTITNTTVNTTTTTVQKVAPTIPAVGGSVTNKTGITR
jgi:hypothetical protein